MNDKTSGLSAFEAPGTEEIEITIRDKSQKFIVCEVSGEQVNELFAPLQSTDPVKKAKAAKELTARVIALCIWRADGSSITFDEAGKFRIALQKKLEKAALDFNGLTPEKADEAKKE
jgi:hypothetical protein